MTKLSLRLPLISSAVLSFSTALAPVLMVMQGSVRVVCCSLYLSRTDVVKLNWKSGATNFTYRGVIQDSLVGMSLEPWAFVA